MPALTISDVSDLMRDLNATYQPAGICAATPRKMKLLLDRLEEYTAEVQMARNKYRALGVASIAFGPTGIAVSELLGGGDVDVAQWRRDMASWQYRLGEYQRLLDTIPESEWDTAAGCSELYPLVTAPLLDGIWYQAMPGIVLNSEEKRRIAEGRLHCPEGVETCTDITYRDPVAGDHPPGHSNPKPPDAMTPFSLGNQIVIYQDFQKENAARLLDDLKDGFDPTRWPWWIKAALIGSAGIVVGLAGLYVYQFMPDPKPKARKRIAKTTRSDAMDNPRKKSTEADLRRFRSAVARGDKKAATTIAKEIDAAIDPEIIHAHAQQVSEATFVEVDRAMAREAVRRAAARTKVARVKSWLREDRERTWETIAADALSEGLPKGRKAGMSDDEIVDAAASFILSTALGAAERAP